MTGDKDEKTPSDPSLLVRALEERDRERAVEILEDPIRRQVLHDLDAEEGAVPLSELAERVADPDVRGGSSVVQRTDGATTEVTAIERAAIQLHHVHLPKLDDHGLVEYDRGEKTIIPKPPS